VCIVMADDNDIDEAGLEPLRHLTVLEVRRRRRVRDVASRDLRLSQPHRRLPARLRRHAVRAAPAAARVAALRRHPRRHPRRTFAAACAS